jgi:hypothetical protein
MRSASVEIDVYPAKRTHLAASSTGGHGYLEPGGQAWIVGGRSLQQGADHRDGGRSDDRARNLGSRGVRYRVAAQPSPAHGLSHRPVEDHVRASDPRGPESAGGHACIEVIAVTGRQSAQRDVAKRGNEVLTDHTLPVLPCRGRELGDVHDLLEETTDGHGRPTLQSRSDLDDHALQCVMRFRFASREGPRQPSSGSIQRIGISGDLQPPAARSALHHCSSSWSWHPSLSTRVRSMTKSPPRHHDPRRYSPPCARVVYAKSEGDGTNTGGDECNEWESTPWLRMFGSLGKCTKTHQQTARSRWWTTSDCLLHLVLSVRAGDGNRTRVLSLGSPPAGPSLPAAKRKSATQTKSHLLPAIRCCPVFALASGTK